MMQVAFGKRGQLPSLHGLFEHARRAPRHWGTVEIYI